MKRADSVGHQTGERLVRLANRRLETASGIERVRWALGNLPGRHVLSTSFGAQSAVMLHLVTRVRPDIPVVFIDTGYHFAETYRFADELTDRLALNLHVYRSIVSPAWQEARHGQRWQQGLDGIEAYNHENKVEPMRRALADLNAGTWLTGPRRNQAGSRETLEIATRQRDRVKFHPVVDWSDRDMHEYLVAHDLPYHPLWHRGYISIGDWHTTRPVQDVDHEEQTRFFGLKRECGLHESA